MNERVANVITHQGNDISALINDTADAHDMPPQLLLAQGISESNLDEYARRPIDPSSDQAYWPDVSGGIWQQTVRYSGTYGLGDGTASTHNINLVMGVLMSDVGRAADIAAQQLGYWWATYGDEREAMGRYNYPAVGFQGNPNAANIQRGWDESFAYLTGAAGPTTPSTVPDPRRAMLIAKCHEYDDFPYTWGGKAPPPEGPGFDCLVAGTMISTDRGPIPIEAIMPGDQVLTRKGYRSVLAAWCVGLREVYTMSLPDGHNITGTASHRIATTNGWRSLILMRASDIILTCEEKYASSTAYATTDIQMQRGHHYETIFNDQEDRYIGPCMSSITDQFQRAMKSITRIEIRSTTNQIILKPFHCPGIEPSRPMQGLIMSDSVVSVERDTDRKAATNQVPTISVLGYAKHGGGMRPDWVAARWCANDAVPLSKQQTTVDKNTVVIPALLRQDGSSVLSCGSALVYDLEVEDQHEFFADGVLVANCSGLVTYCARAVGLDLGDPYYTSAQGIKHYCRPLDLDSEQPLSGDIITFRHTYEGEGENATHVGVWIGPGLMVDTHDNRGVGTTNIYSDYWQERNHWDGLYRPLAYDDTGATEPVEPEPEPEPVPGDDAARVAELETQLGYLMHDVADALQSALDSMRAATPNPSKAQADAMNAMQAAINTLRRGGA